MYTVYHVVDSLHDSSANVMDPKGDVFFTCSDVNEWTVDINTWQTEARWMSSVTVFLFLVHSNIHRQTDGQIEACISKYIEGKKKSLLVPWNQREVCFPCEAELDRSFFPKLILALLTAWKHPMLLHIPLWYLLHYFPSCLFILFAGVPCLHHSYKTLHVCSALPVSRPLGLAFRCFQPCLTLYVFALSRSVCLF